MRPIGGVRGASGGRIGPTRDFSQAATEGTAEASRALIPLEAVSTVREAPTAGQRPYAGFLAQLIATARQLPQTRERRRAEPEDAIAAYNQTVNKGPGAPASGKFSRSS